MKLEVKDLSLPDATDDRCNDQDECVLPAGHGGQLHASAVSKQGMRIVWAVAGFEALVLTTFGENPTWMSMR